MSEARERLKEIRGKLAIGKVPSVADVEWLLDRNERLEKALRLITSCTNRDALLIAVAEAESMLNESNANKGEKSE